MDFDFSTIFILPITIMLAVMASSDLDARERRLAMISFAAHCVCSVAQWVMMTFYYEAGGDVIGYQGWGMELAKLMDINFVQYFPEVLKLACHLPTNMPIAVTGDGTSTGTMSAMAGLFIAIVGPALITMSFGAAWFSWFGQLCLYRVAREELRGEDRASAAIGFLLVPSVVFWGGGYTKESFVIGFFGLLVRATSEVLRHGKPYFVLGIVVGAMGVALIKPYTLFAFFIAMGAFIYADRAWRDGSIVRVRPGYLVLSFLIALGGVVLMGRAFPQFSAEKVGDTLAKNQQVWQTMHGLGTAGGSAVDIGDGGETRSLAGQLLFAPVALINVFFRPVIFEARGAPMIGAAIETSLLTLAIISLLRKSRKVAIDAILKTPLLVFAAVFCLVFGIGVGLATPNLGTLSRYRAPMMPFYVTAVLVLRNRGRAAVRATAPRRIMASRTRAA